MEIFRKANQITTVTFPLLTVSATTYYTTSAWTDLTNATKSRYTWSDGTVPVSATAWSCNPTQLGSTGEWYVSATAAEISGTSYTYTLLKYSANEIQEQTILIKLTTGDIKDVMDSSGRVTVISNQDKTNYSISATTAVLSANIVAIDGIANATHIAGYYPSDVRGIDGAANSSHATGMFPADLRDIGGSPTSAVVVASNVTQWNGVAVTSPQPAKPGDSMTVSAYTNFPSVTVSAITDGIITSADFATNYWDQMNVTNVSAIDSVFSFSGSSQAFTVSAYNNFPQVTVSANLDKTNYSISAQTNHPAYPSMSVSAYTNFPQVTVSANLDKSNYSISGTINNLDVVVSMIESQRGHHTWSGSIFFVNGLSGSDAIGTGTKTNPYKTITSALAQCVSNRHDVIILLPDANGNPTIIDEPNGLTINKNYVFIRGMGRDTAIRRTTSGTAITVNANGVEIEASRIIVSTSGSSNAINVSGSDFVYLHDLWFSDITQDCINVTDSTYARIEKNNIQSSVRDGIRLDQGLLSAIQNGYNIISDNIIVNCSGVGINFLSGCATDSRAQRNIIRDNTTGISIGSSISDVAITDNRYINNTTWLSNNGTRTLDSFNELLIGTPISLDGGLTTIAGMLSKMADNDSTRLGGATNFAGAADSLYALGGKVGAGVLNQSYGTSGGVISGTQTNTFSATQLNDGTYWQIANTAAAAASATIGFDIGTRYPNSIVILGRFTATGGGSGTQFGNVYVRNYLTSAWDLISGPTTRMNTAATDTTHTYTIFPQNASNGQLGGIVSAMFVGSRVGAGTDTFFLDFIHADSFAQSTIIASVSSPVQVSGINSGLYVGTSAYTNFPSVNVSSVTDGVLVSADFGADFYNKIQSLSPSVTVGQVQVSGINGGVFVGTSAYQNFPQVYVSAIAPGVEISATVTVDYVQIKNASLSAIDERFTFSGTDVKAFATNSQSVTVGEVTVSAYKNFPSVNVSSVDASLGVTEVAVSAYSNFPSVNVSSFNSELAVEAVEVSAYSNFPQVSVSAIDNGIINNIKTGLASATDLVNIQTTINTISAVTNQFTFSGSDVKAFTTNSPDVNLTPVQNTVNAISAVTSQFTFSGANVNAYSTNEITVGEVTVSAYKNFPQVYVSAIDSSISIESTLNPVTVSAMYQTVIDQSQSGLASATNLANVQTTVNAISAKTNGLNFSGTDVLAFTTNSPSIDLSPVQNTVNAISAVTNQFTFSGSDVKAYTTNELTVSAVVVGMDSVQNTVNAISAVTDQFTFSGSSVVAYAPLTSANIEDLKNGIFASIIDTKTFSQIMEILLAMATGKITRSSSNQFTYYKQDGLTSLYTLLSEKNERSRS